MCLVCVIVPELSVNLDLSYRFRLEHFDLNQKFVNISVVLIALRFCGLSFKLTHYQIF